MNGSRAPRTNRASSAIGILAGMGPSSTAPFLELVYAECRRQLGARDDGDFPPIVVVSQPVPFFHDRPIDDDAVAAATIEGLRVLERAGAAPIAIACNSVHLYWDQLCAAVDVELLHIVDLALDALPPDVRRVAAVESTPTAAAGLYRDRIVVRGLEFVPVPWQVHIDRLQDLAAADASPAELALAWSQLAGTLPDSVDAVVIGCLDVSGTLVYADLPVPVVDAAAGLASAVVSRWARF